MRLVTEVSFDNVLREIKAENFMFRDCLFCDWQFSRKTSGPVAQPVVNVASIHWDSTVLAATKVPANVDVTTITSASNQESKTPTVEFVSFYNRNNARLLLFMAARLLELFP